jgi:hypothetical protein
MANDLDARVRRFRVELEKVRDRSIRLARRNYRAAYGLMFIAVCSSAAAGILGLGFDVDQRLVSVLALVPVLAVSVTSQLRWEDRSNFYYRQWNAAKAHLRRLDNEMSGNPTGAQLAEISRSYSAIEAQLHEVREGIRWRTTGEGRPERAAK